MSPRGSTPVPASWGSAYVEPTMTAEQRRRRRRRLILLSATLPVWLGMLVVGFVLVAQDVNTRVAIGDFDRERYSTAVQRFAMVEGMDLVELWRAPFNLGTAQYRAGDLWSALGNLDEALADVPYESRCMVQVNRAVVLEAFADEAMTWAQEQLTWAEQAQALVDAGEPYPQDAPWGTAAPWQLREQAQEYAGWAEVDYAAARAARADEACLEGEQSTPEQQEQNEDAQDRISEKQEDAEAAAEPDGEQEAEEPTEPQTEEEQRQQELEERNAEAEARAEAERQEQESGGAGGGAKNW